MNDTDKLGTGGISRRRFVRSATVVTAGVLVAPTVLLSAIDGNDKVDLLTARNLQLDQTLDISYGDRRIQILYSHYREFFKGNYRFDVYYLPLRRSAADYRLELTIRGEGGDITYHSKLPLFGPVGRETCIRSGDHTIYPSPVRKAKFRLANLSDLSSSALKLRLVR